MTLATLVHRLTSRTCDDFVERIPDKIFSRVVQFREIVAAYGRQPERHGFLTVKKFASNLFLEQQSIQGKKEALNKPQSTLSKKN